MEEANRNANNSTARNLNNSRILNTARNGENNGALAGVNHGRLGNRVSGAVTENRHPNAAMRTTPPVTPVRQHVSRLPILQGYREVY